jgi:hypothetical protein
MELPMQRLIEPTPRRRIGRSLAVAAALLCATALSQPNLAYAGPHGGGGGFHGGGFGGFRGGGFHGRDFGRFQGREFFGLGYPYGYGWDYYPDYGYDYDQPSISQSWYYCSDPAGYYPYVTQCNTGWQTVPAS